MLFAFFCRLVDVRRLLCIGCVGFYGLFSVLGYVLCGVCCKLIADCYLLFVGCCVVVWCLLFVIYVVIYVVLFVCRVCVVCVRFGC